MGREQRKATMAALCKKKASKYEARLQRLESETTKAEEVIEEMEKVIARATMGSVIHGIFEVLARAMGKTGAGGAGKLVEINGITKEFEGKTVRGAAEVRKQAHEYGARQLKKGWANTAVAAEIMKQLWKGKEGERTTGQGLKEATTWTNFKRAMNASSATSGVGADGFNAYTLRHATTAIQEEYWQLLVQMIHTNEYPAEYKRWIAMLAVKSADEDPKDISRRRDLWVVCHGQKIVMRMLNREYETAARNSVPLSQAGYARDRNAPEQALVMRLAQAQNQIEQGIMCTGMLDLGQFFMSCVRDVQWECERWTGVDPGVTRVVQALHAQVQGQYETQWGLTEPFDINIGNGQGCVNGAVRSKLLLTAMQRTVHKMCKGWTFDQNKTDGTAGTTPELWYADDASFLSDSVAGLQLAFDCCWVVAKICGLRVMVKGKKKTAYMAVQWVDGVQRDIEMGDDFGIHLPDGQLIPQILAGEAGAKSASWNIRSAKKARDNKQSKPDREVRTYRYLGTEMTPLWHNGQTPSRDEVRKTCIEIIRTIGRIPHMNNDHMRRVMSLAIGGVIGYRGRSTTLTWDDCRAIEAARVLALRQRGFTPGVPHVQIYETPEEGGMGHEHAYAIAAAALIDQVDRALCARDGEPHRIAVIAAIEQTCYRLGCRGTAPIEWEPRHLMTHLNEDNPIEAWLMAKIRTGIKSVATQCERDKAITSPMNPKTGGTWEERGPRLWEDDRMRSGTETKACTFSRQWAEHGIVQWADMIGTDTRKLITKWEQMQERHPALQDTEENRKRLITLNTEMTTRNDGAVREWLQEVAQTKGTDTGMNMSTEAQSKRMGNDGVRTDDGQWIYNEIRNARRAPKSLGGWEYLISWKRGGAPTWVYGSTLTTPNDKGKIRDALLQARRERRRPASMYERLHVREATSGQHSSVWKRRQRIAQACATKQPDDECMRMLWRELEHQAEDVHAGTWKVGSAGTPPTETSATSDTGRWAHNSPGKEQTYYPGETEEVCEQNADGAGTTTTTRTTIGLANTRHMTDGTDTITEDHDERMLDHAKEDETTNIIAEMEARNTADATHVTDQTSGKEDTSRQRLRREETHRDTTKQGASTDIRSIRGGIEKRHNGLRAVAQYVRRRLWEGVQQMKHEAEQHEWEPWERYPLITHIRKLVRRGAECTNMNYWRVEAGEGFSALHDDEINIDPVLRLWQRSGDMEWGDHNGVRDATGHDIRCDEIGRTVMKKHGAQQSWRARWITACVHMQHNFTHAAACDASLQPIDGRRILGVGIYEGAQPDKLGLTPLTDAEKIGEGMWGWAVPTGWEIMDAEMYAVLCYMRKVVAEPEYMSGTPIHERRILILSDCMSALHLIEEAWRRPTAVTGRNTSNGAMLEEICSIRRRVGLVVTMYLPGHRGMVANEYADAVAKAHAWREVDGDITRNIAKTIKTRPCIYEHNDGSGMCTRPLYTTARRGAQAWAVQQLHQTTQNGILAGHTRGQIWATVAARTGHAVTTTHSLKRTAAERKATEEDREDECDRRTDETDTDANAGGGICGVASGFRVGRHARAEHSWEWHAHRKCAAGCGERADMKHVILGRCKGMHGHDIYMLKICKALHAMLRHIPKVAGPTATMPMNQWMCPARVQIRRAIRAVEASRRKGEILGDDWEALRATIAGVLPESTRVKQMERHKERQVATYAIKAITELQKEVLRAMNTRWDEMKAMRHMDDDTFITEKEICRAINLVEDEQAKQHAQQTVQHKKAQARYHEEQLSEVREQANIGRLATARSGSRTALTRRQRQTMTDAQHQECTEKCEQTLSLRACETCAITALAICSACMGRGPHEKWCKTCTKHGRSMCTRCRVDIRRACNRCRQTKWNMTRNTVADTQDAQGTGKKESIERQYTLRHDTDSTQHYADELDAPQTNTDQPIPSTPQVIQPHHHPGTAQLNHNLSQPHTISIHTQPNST